MRVLTTLILVLAGLRPSSQAGGIEKFIAGMDWQKDRVESVKAGSEADFIVSVAFEKKDVWRKDAIAIGIQVVAKNDPRFSAFAGTGWGSHDGSGRRGIGSLMLRQINNEGFQAHLDLSWSDKVKEDGKFDQTFQCKWVDQQVFEKDGFKIEITVKPADVASIADERLNLDVRAVSKVLFCEITEKPASDGYLLKVLHENKDRKFIQDVIVSLEEKTFQKLRWYDHAQVYVLFVDEGGEVVQALESYSITKPTDGFRITKVQHKDDNYVWIKRPWPEDRPSLGITDSNLRSYIEKHLPKKVLWPNAKE